MKKLSLFLLALTIGGTCASFASCGHSHAFDKQVTESTFKATDATCTEKATYYYSCECGEKGTETFEYGETIAHAFTQQQIDATYKATDATCTAKATYYYSCDCGEKGTETFEYGDYAAHVYDQEVAEDTYKATDATCTAKATYYYSCECGEKGTSTFEHGDKLPHVYDQEITSDDYKAADASCTTKATYYKSCECGATGTETFEYGDFVHNYNLEVAEDEHKATDATCRAKATYFKSCICGANGTETFTYGDYAAHVYDQEVVSNTYRDTYASCTQKASYFYSCVCGATGTETFEYGDFSHPSLSEVISDKYKVTDATCQAEGTYYKSCSYCNGAGSETFVGGGLAAHTIQNGTCSVCGTSEAGELEFYLSQDGNSYTVTDIGSFSGSDLIIPAMHEGKPVLKIGQDAFKNNTTLKTVTIPSSVEIIGNNAFYGSSVETVHIGNGVTTIGQLAFYSCQKLNKINYAGTMDSWASISFGEMWIGKLYNLYVNDVAASEVVLTSATTISKYAFKNCNSLTSITIPSCTMSIEDYAFYDCRNLQSLTINEGLTEIGYEAFRNCDKLKTVRLPNSLTSIGNYALSACYRLQYTVVNGGKYLGNETNPYLLLSEMDSSMVTLEVQDGCKLIASSLAYCNSDLQSVVLPDSVTFVGTLAFYHATNLTSVTFGTGLTTIAEKAFEGCTSLNNVVLPDNLKAIAPYTFSGCSSLTNISIGNSVESIGQQAFSGAKLTTIIIPDKVTSIGYEAFRNNDATYLVIGNVADLDDDAFTMCDIETLYFKGSTADWDSFTGKNYYNLRIIENRYYYCEEQADVPSDDNTYWHFVEGVPTVWELPAALTSEELSNIFAGAANSVYEMTGITNPNAPVLASLVIPDETNIATTEHDIKQVKINIAGLPAVLQMVSDLYANENFVITGDVVLFDVTVQLPNGPDSTAPVTQSFSLLVNVDVANGKIYFEAAVTVQGMMQYNYCDIDFDFDKNEIISFRYLVHMGDMGVYGDVKVDAEGNMYINDFDNPSADFINAMDALKAAYVAAMEVGQTLTADFSNEVQTYMDTVMAINASL